MKRKSARRGRRPLQGGALGGEDAGDFGKVVSDEEIRPLGRFEEGADGGERVVAEFEDEEAAGY